MHTQDTGYQWKPDVDQTNQFGTTYPILGLESGMLCQRLLSTLAFHFKGKFGITNISPLKHGRGRNGSNSTPGCSSKFIRGVCTETCFQRQSPEPSCTLRFARAVGKVIRGVVHRALPSRHNPQNPIAHKDLISRGNHQKPRCKLRFARVVSKVIRGLYTKT